MTDIALFDQIVKTTDKAILVDVGDRNVWIPMSITDVTDKGVIMVPTWFARKNGIGCYGYRTCSPC